MNTKPYSNLNNCAEWRIYKDVDTARNNKSEKYFSIGFKNSSIFNCFGGTKSCSRCYFVLKGSCAIDPNIYYLMDSIEQLTNDNYISITPKSYPEYFI